MREIKFRAWDGKNLRYDVTGLEHGEENEMAGVFLDGDFWKVGHPEEVLKTYDRCATLMQFTGLRDQIGKEIYEGDIVDGYLSFQGSRLPTIGEIVWCDEFAAFAVRNEGGETLLHNHFRNSFEVIGNIYHHKHLLEE